MKRLNMVLGKGAKISFILVLSVSLSGSSPFEKNILADAGEMPVYGNWKTFTEKDGLPADKVAAYQDAIAQMYDTAEWEEVRARNGWVNIHNSGDDFNTFLEAQETAIGDLMKKLGFL